MVKHCKPPPTVQARLDNLTYEAMVADVTMREREAEDLKSFLPTTRAQVSYGTCFAFHALHKFELFTSQDSHQKLVGTMLG